MIKIVSFLTLTIALSACSTMKPGEYGLLAVKEPHYAGDGTAKVTVDQTIVLGGSSCIRIAAIFFPIALHENRDAAIFNALNNSKRSDAIGLADVKIYERTRMFWPLYFDKCYVVEGHPAISQ